MCFGSCYFYPAGKNPGTFVLLHIRHPFVLLKPVFILWLALYTSFTRAQTPCSVEWAGNVLPTAGTLTNNFTAAGSIAATWKTTAPTFGSFSAGRPNYLQAYSLMIGTSRGGGFGARTTIKFASPVDFYRLRIWDLRGDGLTSEAQRIEAFNGGVSVTRLYSSDNPSLVSINSGTNTINGSATTTSASQGLVHVSFATAVDSIIVRSVGNSDFVVIELLCPDGATDVALSPLRVLLNNSNHVQLNWSTLFETNHRHIEIERSINGSAFETIGRINGSGNRSSATEYRFTDPYPAHATNYYRLKIVALNGNYFYSEIVSVRAAENTTAYYDAAQNAIILYQFPGKKINYSLYNSTGSLQITGTATDYQNIIPVNGLSPGVYFLNTEAGRTLKLLIHGNK